MNENLNEVPNILTGKDLDYLSDMFNWNCVLAKKAHHYSEEVLDEEIKEMILSVYDASIANMNTVLEVLNSKGEVYGK